MKHWGHDQLHPEDTNRLDFSAIAIVICESLNGGLANGGLRHRGKVPSRVPVASPGQRSGVMYCSVRVSVMLRNSVWDDCLLCCPLVSAVVSAVLYSHLRTAKSWDNTFGVLALCQVGVRFLRHRGRFP